MSGQLVATTLLPLLLIVIMFGLGLTLTVEDFKRVAKQPFPVALGLFCQLIILPSCALGLCYLFELDSTMAIGLMLLAASPGGPTSNYFSKIAGGDLALNLTLTAVNCVFSPLTMPLISEFAIRFFVGQDQQIGFQTSKMTEIFFLVLVPVSAGLAFHNLRPKAARALDRPIQIFSAIALLIIIVGTVVTEWAPLKENFPKVGWSVLTFNLVSLTLGYWIPKAFKLGRAQATAIAFEIGVHSSGLALFVAISILHSPLMAIPAATYSIFMYLTAATLATFIRSRK